MTWFNKKIEGFKQLPNPYFTLHIASRFLFGLGLGILLATWLPIWTGWIFIVLAMVIVIPGTIIMLKR